MRGKELLKRVVYGYRASSASYVGKLRELGATIGDDVNIHAPRSASIDLSAPFLLRIGDHVNIAGPATILTHDYSWSVIKGKWGDLIGNEKPVVIGSNVFIGWGATVLCGTTVEDNVVIGAHSVVSGHVQGDSVYGGAPAKRICSLEEYRKKGLACSLRRRSSSIVATLTDLVRFLRKRSSANTSPCSAIPVL